MPQLVVIKPEGSMLEGFLFLTSQLASDKN